MAVAGEWIRYGDGRDPFGWMDGYAARHTSVFEGRDGGLPVPSP